MATVKVLEAFWGQLKWIKRNYSLVIGEVTSRSSWRRKAFRCQSPVRRVEKKCGHFPEAVFRMLPKFWNISKDEDEEANSTLLEKCEEGKETSHDPNDIAWCVCWSDCRCKLQANLTSFHGDPSNKPPADPLSIKNCCDSHTCAFQKST